MNYKEIVMNIMAFQGLNKTQPQRSFQPKFAAMPAEIKDALEKTKQNYQVADDRLVASIEHDLDQFVINAEGYDNHKSEADSWVSFFTAQTILLVNSIEKIATIEVLDSVIQIVDEHDGFNNAKYSYMKKYVYDALIQKTSELYHPVYERQLDING